MKFGDILRNLREEKGLTQKELGIKINISDRVIGYWESNDRFPKDSKILVDLSIFFDVSVDYLLGKSEEKINQFSRDEMQLVNCFRSASIDDKNVVWAVLDKYKHKDKNRKNNEGHTRGLAT